LLEELKSRLDDCVTQKEFYKSTNDVSRAMASITVFKTQIKIFERKFHSDRDYDSRVYGSEDINKNTSAVFKR